MGRIVPVRELTGLSGQNRLISSLINHIKIHIPWMKSAENLSQGTPQPSKAANREELRLWEF